MIVPFKVTLLRKTADELREGQRRLLDIATQLRSATRDAASELRDERRRVRGRVQEAFTKVYRFEVPYRLILPRLSADELEQARDIAHFRIHRCWPVLPNGGQPRERGHDTDDVLQEDRMEFAVAVCREGMSNEREVVSLPPESFWPEDWRFNLWRNSIIEHAKWSPELWPLLADWDDTCSVSGAEVIELEAKFVGALAEQADDLALYAEQEAEAHDRPDAPAPPSQTPPRVTPSGPMQSAASDRYGSASDRDSGGLGEMPMYLQYAAK